jgi:hypothetical protein
MVSHSLYLRFSNDWWWVFFHVVINHLCIIFEEMSTYILFPFLNWVISSSIFFLRLGFELRTLCLVGRLFYCLNHSASPFLWFLNYKTSLYILFFPLLLCWVGVHCGIYTKVLIIRQIYHTWIYPFHCSPLSPFPSSETVSTGIIFTVSYMCTHFLHCIHPPTPFPCHLPPTTSANPPSLYILKVPYQMYDL